MLFLWYLYPFIPIHILYHTCYIDKYLPDLKKNEEPKNHLIVFPEFCLLLWYVTPLHLEREKDFFCLFFAQKQAASCQRIIGYRRDRQWCHINIRYRYPHHCHRRRHHWTLLLRSWQLISLIHQMLWSQKIQAQTCLICNKKQQLAMVCLIPVHKSLWYRLDVTLQNLHSLQAKA